MDAGLLTKLHIKSKPEVGGQKPAFILPASFSKA